MTIDWAIVARAIHVTAVVVWVGGVALVTLVVLPGLTAKAPGEWRPTFDAIERRFAPQARIAIVLVLLSGLYMLYAYNLWDRFGQARFWWMDLMVAVWLIFALMLFVIEPLATRLAARRGGVVSRAITPTRLLRAHRVLLALSLAAIFAAVAGSHGLF